MPPRKVKRVSRTSLSQIERELHKLQEMEKVYKQMLQDGLRKLNPAQKQLVRRFKQAIPKSTQTSVNNKSLNWKPAYHGWTDTKLTYEEARLTLHRCASCHTQLRTNKNGSVVTCAKRECVILRRIMI